MVLDDKIQTRLKVSLTLRDHQVIQIDCRIYQNYTNLGLRITVNISFYNKQKRSPKILITTVTNNSL